MTVHPTLRRLNSEWELLSRQLPPERWAAEPVLAGYVDLGSVLTGVRRQPDAVLGALLRCRDATACRVVLQAMLGRVVLDAARDKEHDLDDYVGELWLGIAGYPLDRRPARIAANLVLDAAKRVRARQRAAPVDPARLAGLPQRADDPAGRVTLVLARARRTDLLDAGSHAALWLVYSRGLDSTQAARVLGVTPAALRQRCHRALRRLAEYADALGEAVG